MTATYVRQYLSPMINLLITTIVLFGIVGLPVLSNAQELPHAHAENRTIDFPDIPGFVTLKVDLHMHTVFSDGAVWPSIRVEEAIRDGLDAIAMTEHLEYQPHDADIPHPDRNRAFEVATEAAKGSELIILPGSEITRSMPPGHANAVFISDANKLLIADSVAVFEEAGRQQAFVFWNHPNWTAQRANGVAAMTATHRHLFDNNLLHGIEVVNEITYSDEALQIALDNNLAIIGASDIHGLVDWKFNVAHGGHRPVTLVFARERSVAGIREALFARRTAAYYDNIVIGREEVIEPLVSASLVVTSANYQGESSVLTVNIENRSDLTFILDNQSAYTFHNSSDVMLLAPNAVSTLEVKVLERLERVVLDFEVLNTVTAPATHSMLQLTVDPN